MTRRDNGLTDESVPDVFCWTKFGTEAGEGTPSIFRRKEIERQRNSGIFLWGIGTSIRPSLPELLEATGKPEVLFSPMKSAPAKRDVAPSELVVWCGAVGYDGKPYAIPRFSLVTSGRERNSLRGGHFALVCMSENPLTTSPASAHHVAADDVRNLKTGSNLGASQVTSVVRRVSVGSNGHKYPVAIRAKLVYPYLVRLSQGVPIPERLRLDRATESRFETTLEELVRMRCSQSASEQLRTEQLVLI